MRREIARWFVLGVALVLGLGAVASGQRGAAEGDHALAIAQLIEKDIAEKGIFADEREYRAKVLEALQEELGAEHPLILNRMAEMANEAFARYERGEYANAQEDLEGVLAVYRSALGEEHPGTLTVMNNLAGVFLEQGKYLEAENRFEEVLEARRRILGEEHPITLRTMSNVAGAIFEKGDIIRARAMQEEILGTLRRVLGEEHPGTLDAKNNLARSLAEQGDFTEALTMFEEIVNTEGRVLGNEHPDTLNAVANLAATLSLQGDFTRAREMKEQIIDIRIRTLGREHPDTLKSMNSLSNTLSELGDFTPARVVQEEVIEILSRVLGKEHPATLSAKMNLAVTFYQQGDLMSARYMFEEVLNTRGRVLGKEHPDTLNAMASLAGTLTLQGDLRRARAMHEEGLDALSRVLGEEHPDTLNAMANLAITLKNQGDITRAQEVEEEVVEIRSRVLGEKHHDTLTSMNNLGNTLESQGKLTRAREIFEEVIKIQSLMLGEEHPNTLTARDNLANTLYEQGKFTRAREMEEEILRARSRVLGVKHPDTLRTMNNLARTLHQKGEFTRARELFEEVLKTQTQVLGEEHPDTLTAMSNLAVTLYKQDDLDGAHRLFLRALDGLEAQTAKSGDSENIKSVFKTQYDDIYRATLKTLLELGHTNEALDVLERFRAQSFLRMFFQKDFLASELPPELEEKRRGHAVRYDQTLRRLDKLRTGQDEEGIAAVRKEQWELHRELERIQVEIRRISPRLAELEDPRPVTTEEIRQNLDPGTVMISYSVSGDHIDLFVLPREGKLEAYQIPLDVEKLWLQIRRFYGQLQGSSKGFASSRSEMGKWLYERLIRPAARRIEQSERLLIIPDGALHYLPFAALVRTTDDGTDQYLVEWKPVHTAISATVHALLKKERSATEQTGIEIAAFGNPSYPGEQGDGTKGLATVRSAIGRGLIDGLSPLPHSGREATAIGVMYPGEATQTWTGQDATEERAKALGKDVDIVHFAVHGTVDPDYPFDSFLAFTIPNPPSEGRDNGLLQVWEIFENVRLDADLVVLSACQTALGENRGGEGIISLSRAFQYAGARTVAASLWRVSDASTAELMIRFYRHLKGGKSKDEALRAAQVELIRDGPIEVENEKGEVVEEDYSAPYHWAAFQLIGDWK